MTFSVEVRVRHPTTVQAEDPNAGIILHQGTLSAAEPHTLPTQNTLPSQHGKRKSRKALERTTKKLNDKLQRLESKFDSLEKANSTMTTDLNEARQTIKILSQSSEGYRSARNRFIAAFLRNVIGRDPLLRSDLRVLMSGEVIPHEGDPLGDAQLYNDGWRKDVDIYTLLYGLEPDEVLGYSMLAARGRLIEASILTDCITCCRA